MGSLVKQYYALGLYTVDDLKVFVKAAYITADEFKTLSGTDYAAQSFLFWRKVDEVVTSVNQIVDILTKIGFFSLAGWGVREWVMYMRKQKELRVKQHLSLIHI